MGWWSEGIMGGDTPLDIKFCFEERFGSDDPVTTEEENLPEFRVPTTDEGLSFLKTTIEQWHFDSDTPIIKQVTGYLLMKRAAPMNDELRRIVIEGIDTETVAGAKEWNDPTLRLKTLADFRALVVAYPAEGGNVDLPHQPGLFETIFND